ncbi:uncharacterized protein LOC144327716 [Podarcis muralis]
MGGKGHLWGGLIVDPPPTQPPDLPATRGRSRRSAGASRRASGTRGPSRAPTRRRATPQITPETASGSGFSRAVSSQSVSATPLLNPESDSSIEDSLPVPARKSSGGKRRRKKASRKRAKRRKDDSSSSYSGTSSSDSDSEAVRIWMVGHSIVHWAGIGARQSGLGAGLGLPPHVHVSWLSRRGMRWSEFLPLIRRQMFLEGPPTAVVVHLGENDLVSTDCRSLRELILSDLEVLRALLPSAKIFWSRLLQRRVWRGSRCPAATERARKRINAAVARKVLELGGEEISHPKILFRDESLFREDGVHLSALGNEAWLGAVVAKLRSWLGL